MEFWTGEGGLQALLWIASTWAAIFAVLGAETLWKRWRYGAGE